MEHSYRFRQETGYEGADWAFDCVGSSDEGISVGDRVEFSKPVDVGDRVTAVCEVVDDLGQDKYQLTTDVVNGEGRLIEGQAVVLVDDPPEIGTLSVEPISGTGSMQGSSR